MNKKSIVIIVASTVWISLSEFFRNELLFKNYWTDHYEKLGIVFPSEPINGMVWGLWSLVLATLIYILSKKHSLRETVIISWLFAFLLMWIVIGNLGVLPVSLLIFALPLSFLEVFVATWIAQRLGEKQGTIK